MCRNEQDAAGCSAAATLQIAPGANGAFTDTLPAALATGRPRVLTYFVELDNRKGRSAGLSNGAQILAGEAPAAVAGLRAEMRRDGVLLRWTAAPPGAAPAAVRLDRKLLTPAAKKPAPKANEQGLLAPPPEPQERTLLVEAGEATDRALDKDIRFGEKYEYRAQRVARVMVNGQTLELAGPLSAPRAHRRGECVSSRSAQGVGRRGHGRRKRRRAGDRPELAAGYRSRSGGLYGLPARGQTAGWQRISAAQPVVGPGITMPSGARPHL